LLAKLPESPKFLLAKGKHDETINCLKYVYGWNNKTDDDFPASLSIVVLIISQCSALFNYCQRIFIILTLFGFEFL